MRLATLAAFALLTAGTVPAATTFATITGSGLTWSSAGTTNATTTVNFTYDGVKNNAPYNSTLYGATLTYSWAPVSGTLATSTTIFGTSYWEAVTGDFSFTYTPTGSTDLLTVDFSTVDAYLIYTASPTGNDLELVLNPTTTGGTAPSFSSDVLTFPAISDWAYVIDFGNKNPGYASGNIKNFTYGFNSTVSTTGFPSGQIPEPASALMAGAGLLAVGGLLRLRKRFQK
jgi:hypothetical protein